VDGALLFSRFTLGPARIMAVRFDLARRKLLGKPVTLMDGVPVKAGAGALAVVADNGTLAYLGRTAGNGMIQIVDEHGAVVGELPELVGAEQMVWSPDGQHIAMFSVEDDKPDIWVYDVTSRARKQITRTGGWLPAWTPDGTRIGFIEWGPGGTGGGKAMWVAADGGEPPVAIPGTSSLGSSITQVSFTSDGKYAVVRAQVRSGEPAETPHVLAVPLAGGPPLPTGVGGRVPSSLAVSPDGQWIAYAWNKAGRTDVYVSPFLGRGGEMQLSTDGGSQPRWSADGRKLVYRAGRGKNVLLVATLDLRGARPRLVRSDSLVFEPSHSDPTIVSYAVHPDGKRFLVARNAGETKLFVVTNWMTEVRAKLDGK
jgi:TolB protein